MPMSAADFACAIDLAVACESPAMFRADRDTGSEGREMLIAPDKGALRRIVRLHECTGQP